MARHRHYHTDPHIVRQSIRNAVEISDKMLSLEQELIGALSIIDQNRFYTRVGFNSLSGFCVQALKLSKNQSQRIVTRVRRVSMAIECADTANQGATSGTDGPLIAWATEDGIKA